MAQLLTPGMAKERGTMKRYLAIGLLGAAIALAVLVAVAAGQGLRPLAPESDVRASATTDAAAGNTAALCPGDCQLGLGGRAPSRLSPPNETDAGGSGAGSPAWSDARDYAPAAASPATDHGQQRRLYEIEVRDTGAGTSGGPCLITPEHLCP